MIIKLPKIVKPLKIGEYAPGSEEEIQVWVNPPVKLLQEYDETIAKTGEILREIAKKVTTDKKTEDEHFDTEKPVEPATVEDGNKEPPVKVAFQDELEKIGARQIGILSELWSQGPEDTHYSVEEIQQLIEGTRDTDPNFWTWLKNTTILMIVQHRNDLKKA